MTLSTAATTHGEESDRASKNKNTSPGTSAIADGGTENKTKGDRAGLSLATKGGKLASTAPRGHLTGQIIQAPQNGFWGTPALCKAVPGKRGYGWLSTHAQQPTCPKCLRLWQRIRQGEGKRCSSGATTPTWLNWRPLQ